MHSASLTQSIIILWIVTVQLMLRLLLLPKKAFKSFTGNSFGKKGSKYHPNFTHSLLTNFGVPTRGTQQQRHRSRLRPSRKFSWAKKGNNSKTYLRVIFCSWNGNYPPGCDLTCPHTRHRHRINNQSVSTWGSRFFLSFQKTHRKGNIQSEFIFMEKGRIWSEMQSHCILLWLIDELPPPPPSRLSSKTVQFSEIPTKSCRWRLKQRCKVSYQKTSVFVANFSYKRFIFLLFDAVAKY